MAQTSVLRKCRGIHVPRIGNQFVRPLYCEKCRDHVRVQDKRCECCFTKIEYNKRPHKLWPHKFSKEIEKLESQGFSIDNFIPVLPEDSEPKVKMKLGNTIQLNYYVPIRYLLEFRDLKHQDDDDAYNKFFKQILSRCARTV